MPAWLGRDHDCFPTVQPWLLTFTLQYHLKMICEGPNDVIMWQRQHSCSVCPIPATVATIGRVAEVAVVKDGFNKIKISEVLWIYWSIWTPAYERQSFCLDLKTGLVGSSNVPWASSNYERLTSLFSCLKAKFILSCMGRANLNEISSY